VTVFRTGEDAVPEKIISEEFEKQIVRPILKEHFQRDEFIDRLNEIVYFLPFSQSELVQLETKEPNFWAQKVWRT